MNLLRKIQYSQYWNIGFCNLTPEELIQGRKLNTVRWLNHPYRDRWFADPFLLRVTDREIVVLVEECPIEAPKGIISELVISRKTMTLKDRYVLLEKETHLSYPAIIKYTGKFYVYPENGLSGQLSIYEYDEVNHRLVNPKVILSEAVADATIFFSNGLFYLMATKYPDTQNSVYLYSSASLFGPFKQIKVEPIQESLSFSRNGGAFFYVAERMFRVAQNCSIRYGGSLSIMSVTSIGDYNEAFAIGIAPLKCRYGLGVHTINFERGICVIDGCGYYMPILGRLYYFVRKMTERLK